MIGRSYRPMDLVCTSISPQWGVFLEKVHYAELPLFLIRFPLVQWSLHHGHFRIVSPECRIVFEFLKHSVARVVLETPIVVRRITPILHTTHSDNPR